MNKNRLLIVLLATLTLMGSCNGPNQPLQQVTFRGAIFGTYYSVAYYSPNGRNYQAEVDSFFKEFNRSVSYYDPNSVISRINRNETDRADEYFIEVLKRSLEVAEITSGAFDPTVSPLVNAWGFGFEERSEPSNARIDSLRRVIGYQRVGINGNRIIKEIPEIQFDFNAIAKGYAADLAGQLLQSKGIKTYMVEIGGDLVARGLKPDGTAWRIGLEEPAADMEAPQQWAFLVEMHDKAVATSGNYRKYYEKGGQRFSHTIDPQTGRPVQHNLLSVSVFADDCMTADAFATAFMVMGFEKARQFVESRNDLQAFFIYSTGSDTYGSYATPGLKVVPRSEVRN
jgi:FAD:protein FMN transferase